MAWYWILLLIINSIGAIWGAWTGFKMGLGCAVLTSSPGDSMTIKKWLLILLSGVLGCLFWPLLLIFLLASKDI